MTRTLLLTGDSLLALLSQPRVEPLRRQGWLVHNAAMGGATSLDTRALAPGLARVDADRVAISLGMNDTAAWSHVALTAFRAALDELLAILGPARCIAVLPPQVDQARLSAQFPRPASELERYRAALRDSAAAAGAAVLDLEQLAGELRATGRDPHDADGVHLSLALNDALVARLAALLDQ